MDTFKAYAALVFVLLLVIAVTFFGYHERQVGEASGKAIAAAALQSQNAAVENYNGCAASLKQVNADATATAAIAKAQNAHAAQLVAQSKADADTAAKSAALWQRKFEKASKTPACAGLMETEICPAVFEPEPASASSSL